MDVKAELIKGLQSTPKYIPVWYRYDKQGSIYNDRCLTDNEFYYFYRCEVSVLKEKVREIVSQMQKPCTLVEMGSGNSEKSRLFIDTILENQKSLTYIPVDISEEFLKETSDALADDYKGLVDVQPIPGDYSVGIDKLGNVSGHKLIIWLGGGFQNQAYDVQVQRIASLSRTMTEQDRLIIALDVTQNAQEAEHAYLDPTGVSAPLYLNAIWRLNKEYNGNVDTDKIDLECKFVPETSKHRLSTLLVRARSTCNAAYQIPELDINLTLENGEYINMYEGEGVSCKYSEEQIKTFVESGNQTLHRIWTDREGHVALCCIKPQHISQNETE